MNRFIAGGGLATTLVGIVVNAHKNPDAMVWAFVACVWCLCWFLSEERSRLQ